MINYFSEKPERSSRDEYLRKLAENAVDQVLTHKDPNAQAWQTVRRNLGLPNEYLEFKPKEPEQYNLPEFRPSFIPQPARRKNPFRNPPTPSFKNWEEFGEWLLKDLPKPHNLPQNSNPFKLLETGNDTVHQNDYPEIKSSLPEQFNAPEFKPWRPNNFQELGIMAGYARDNLNDKTVKGLTALYYLVDALQKKQLVIGTPNLGIIIEVFSFAMIPKALLMVITEEKNFSAEIRQIGMLTGVTLILFTNGNPKVF